MSKNRKGDEQFEVDGSVAIGRWTVAKRWRWGWWRKESSWPRGSILKRVKLPPPFASSSMLAPRIRAARSSLDPLHTVSQNTENIRGSTTMLSYKSRILEPLDFPIIIDSISIQHYDLFSPSSCEKMTFNCNRQRNSKISRVKLRRCLTLASPSNRFAAWHLSQPTLWPNDLPLYFLFSASVALSLLPQFIIRFNHWKFESMKSETMLRNGKGIKNYRIFSHAKKHEKILIRDVWMKTIKRSFSLFIWFER